MHSQTDEEKPLFVKDLAEGRTRTGLADMRSSILTVTLFDFDGAIDVDESKEACFVTEKGEILTLHNYFAGGRGWRQGSGASVWNNTIQANQMVLGPDPWKENDLLRRCTFKVEGASDLLHNVERFEAIEQAEFGNMPALDVFTIAADGAHVTLTHDVRGGGFNRRATSIEPKFVIEFDVPQTIAVARTMVNNVVAFLSLAQVRRLSIDEFTISRLTEAEIDAAIKADKRLPHNHTVRFYSTDKLELGKQPWVGRAFAHVRKPEDVATFAACLKIWLERGPEWRAATSLMLENFLLAREISGNRLLSATRWIERIPGTVGKTAISDAHIDQIVAAAIEKASDLGHAGLERRMRGSLKAIGAESNQTRIQRIVDGLGPLMTTKVARRGLVYGTVKGRDFRGQTAHGRVSLKTEREQSDFELAIAATECLAYLLMLSDFPLDIDAIRRVDSSTLPRHFSAFWQHYFTEWGVASE